MMQLLMVTRRSPARPCSTRTDPRAQLGLRFTPVETVDTYSIHSPATRGRATEHEDDNMVISMPTYGSGATGRRRASATGRLLLGLMLSSSAATADTLPSRADIYPEMRRVLSTGSTVVGEPIEYPSGAPALITAMEIVLEPGQQTGWHTHPVPLVGYILEGELTVDYGPKGLRVYRKGDALAEAMNQAHNGRNTGPSPVRILAVFLGMEGVRNSVPAAPPARR